MPSINRAELRRLALIRSQDARVLLRAGRYDGAYYLSGYVVECALKACIAKATRRFEFPDRERASQSWTHSLENLLKAAGLETALRQEMTDRKTLEANWLIVRDWKETSRYER
jgi:HEPN domain-containing protein